MITLAAVLLTTILACCTVQRPWIPLALALTLVVLVPEAASTTVGGGINPGNASLAAVAVVQVAARGRCYLDDLLASFPLTAALLVWLACTIATAAAADGSAHLGFIVNGLVVPVSTFFLVRHAVDDDPLAGRRLCLWLVALVALECVIALAAWTGTVQQPWADELASRYGWWHQDFGRALGTLDSPLDLGTVVVIGTSLLAAVRRTWLSVTLAALFVTTTVAAQSRTALLVCLLALLAIAIERRVPVVTLVGLALGLGAGCAAVAALLPGVADGLLSKFRDDGGSGQSRLLGLTEGVPAAFDHPVLGGGSGAAADVARSLGLWTSFENPFLILTLEWGLLGTLCQFGAMTAVLLLRGDGVPLVPGGRLAGTAALVTILSYSSIAFPSGSAILLWVALGLAVPASAVRADRGSRSQHPGAGPAPQALSRRPAVTTHPARTVTT